MIYRTDYHIHTIYSDGMGNFEDYLGYARKEGISEIGFSDHLTLTDTQQKWSMNPDLLNEYCDKILELGNKNSNIIIRIGLEVDYFPEKEEEIERVTEKLPLDYLIGSVHYMDNGSVDLGPGFYKKKDIDKLYESYFDLVSRAAETKLFDIMGHPDLVRIFRYFPAKNPEQLYRALARNLKKSDVAIEINTNGMNKPLLDFYPDPAYLHIFSEEGVPVCVNSDSHRPTDTAQYFNEAYTLVVNAGYKEMATFEKKKRKMVSIK